MKTVNYILRVEQKRAAGGAGRIPGRRVLPSGEDKVVDLAAWKAENLMPQDEADAGVRQTSALGRHKGRGPARRRKPAAQDWAELAATLAVAAAFVALLVRVLMF